MIAENCTGWVHRELRTSVICYIVSARLVLRLGLALPWANGKVKQKWNRVWNRAMVKRGWTRICRSSQSPLRFRSDVLFQASSLLGGRRHRRAAAACTVDRLRPLVWRWAPQPLEWHPSNSCSRQPQTTECRWQTSSRPCPTGSPWTTIVSVWFISSYNS